MKRLLLMIGVLSILVGCQNDEGGDNGLNCAAEKTLCKK